MFCPAGNNYVARGAVFALRNQHDLSARVQTALRRDGSFAKGLAVFRAVLRDIYHGGACLRGAEKSILVHAKSAPRAGPDDGGAVVAQCQRRGVAGRIFPYARSPQAPPV